MEIIQVSQAPDNPGLYILKIRNFQYTAKVSVIFSLDGTISELIPVDPISKPLRIPLIWVQVAYEANEAGVMEPVYDIDLMDAGYQPPLLVQGWRLLDEEFLMIEGFMNSLIALQPVPVPQPVPTPVP